jgi:hypothetical protein
MCMSNFFRFILAVIFFAGTSSVFAQERSESEVYSMMMFNFTRYVQWPDSNQPGEFVIGVVGNNEILTTLSTWYSGKPRGTKTYVIKKFNSAADVTDCQVVFIDKSKSSEFEAINNKVKGKGTLIITDKKRPGREGQRDQL